MTRLDISISSLTDDADVPGRDWLSRYWAARDPHPPALPRVRIGRLGVTVHVDGADGYVWSTPDTPPPGVRPAWDTADGPAVMIRHPLTDERRHALGDLFAERMSPPVDYHRVGITDPATVDTLRRHGWDPADALTLVGPGTDERGWLIDDPADLAALVSRPPRWWLAAGYAPPQLCGGAYRMRGRDIAALIAAGVTGEVYRALVPQCDDWRRMLDAAPPRIPDDATRVAFPIGLGRHRYAASAVAARAYAATHPAGWLLPVRVERGPTPEHVSDDDDPFVIWSDGELTRGWLIRDNGLAAPPTALDTTEPPAAYGLAEPAIRAVLAARRLGPADRWPRQWWLPWRHAIAHEAQVTHRYRHSRLCAGGRRLTHTLAATVHMVRRADGVCDLVHVIESVFGEQRRIGGAVERHHVDRVAVRSPREASAIVAERTADRYPAYSVGELARMVERTPEALRSAIHAAAAAEPDVIRPAYTSTNGTLMYPKWIARRAVDMALC